MAETVSNPFALLMGALDKKGGGKGVRGDEKVNPILTSAERQRYTNIFSIMKEVISPGPEARDIGGTTAAVGNVEQITKAAKESTGGEGLSLGRILGMAAPLVAGIGAAIAGLVEGVQESFNDLVGDILNFGSEVATDIGTLPAMALKLAKFLPLGKLKFIPLLGPMINFGMSFKAFKDGNIVEGLWELTSGIAGLIPGIGTVISLGMDTIKMIYESTAPEDENGVQQGFGDWLGDMATKLGQWLFQKLKDGNIPFFSGLYRFGKAIGNIIGGDVNAGLEDLALVLPNMFGLSGDNVKWISGTLKAFMGSETGQMISSGLSDAGDFISDLFTKMGEGIMSFFTSIKEWVSGKIEEGLNTVKAFFGFGDDNEIDPTSTAEYKFNQERKKENMAMADKQRILRERDPDGYAAAFANRGVIGESGKNMLVEYIEANSIEDGYITHNGIATRIDSDDSILAAKPGGPIDKMLDQNSAIQSKQLNVLVAIRNEVQAIKNAMSTNVAYADSTLTQEFYR